MRTTELISEIDAFLEETGMAPSYFGVKACGNSKLVERLRTGKRRVWPETEMAVRVFIASERSKRPATSQGEAA